MLSNAYFLAKFRFDTADNEPAKKLQNFANFPNFANPNARFPDRRGRDQRAAQADREGHQKKPSDANHHPHAVPE